MSARIPSYDAVEYWDAKYRREQDPFDWLLPAHSLREALNTALTDCAKPDNTVPGPRILHIGSGTSLLSFSLRTLVDDVSLVHHVDFSSEAVEWGRELEESMLRLANPGSPVPDSEKRMKWMQASLLSTHSLLQAGCEPSSYSLIVDKSTADSVACGPDIEVRVPFHLYTSDAASDLPAEHESATPDLESVSVQSSEYYVLPVHLLALNLAFLTIPGALWVSLSYSKERCWFLDSDATLGAAEDEAEADTEAAAVEDDEFVHPQLLALGFPDPRRLWKLEKTVAVETAEKRETVDQVVHRQVALHYMYTLRRTDVKLELREQMPAVSQA
jgi:EEF1A lysine methyltransferase 4